MFVYKVQLLRCCSKSKSSNTQVCCGLDFLHASNLNFIKQTLEFIDRHEVKPVQSIIIKFNHASSPMKTPVFFLIILCFGVSGNIRSQSPVNKIGAADTAVAGSDSVSYEPSHNALLGAITWPDAPEFVRQNPNWNNDTIPGFSSRRFTYEVNVPHNARQVPALVAHPIDVNAHIKQDRAIVFHGPDTALRTTTFSVTAEDDTTVREYAVVIDQQKPVILQPFSADPVFSEITYGGNSYIEISKPGDSPVNLSNYLVLRVGRWASGWQEAVAEQDYRYRYSKYVPGYDFKATSEDEWDSIPGILEKDIHVSPIIYPHDCFVMADIDPDSLYPGMPLGETCNVIFNGTTNKLDSTGEAGVFWLENPKYTHLEVGAVPLFEPGDDLCLLELLNDSIKKGTKGISDPADFRLVDVFGDFGSQVVSPGTDTLKGAYTIRRKPTYWKGDTLSGLPGSWADTDSTSEWVTRDIAFYLEQGYSREQARQHLTRDIGSHTFAPVTEYVSTIYQLPRYYDISDGYHSPQNIRGVAGGTRVSDFLDNLRKKDEGQSLKVIGKSSSDVLTEGDMLVVRSADSTNVTKYVIDIGRLSNDTRVRSNKYAVDRDSSQSTISGIPFGTSIKEVRENITIPEKAMLHVINVRDELVPFRRRNYDTHYVRTQATGYVYFEVRAEDFVTKETYPLKVAIDSSAAYAMSDLYEVDQELQLVSHIPEGTNTETLFRHLKPNLGAHIKLIDTTGSEKTEGKVLSGDRILATSADSARQKVYFLSFLGSGANDQAYAVSDVLGVDQMESKIWGVQQELMVKIFMDLLTPAPGATLTVLDANGEPVTSNNDLLDRGFTLKVTSGDSSRVKIYDLEFSSERPGCCPFPISDTFTINHHVCRIEGIPVNITVHEMLDHVYPSYGYGQITILDADSNAIDSGRLNPGYILKISDDYWNIYYDLLFETAVESTLQITNIIIYPNPAEDHLLVDGVPAKSIVMIRDIFGVTRKILKEEELVYKRISIADLPPGIYFLLVKKGSFRSDPQKFIKIP